MKPVFNIKHVTLNIHTYQRAPALVALGAAFAAAAATPAQSPVEKADIEIPAHGEYWPGEGGSNGGFVPARGDVPAHYLIVGANDIGDYKHGGHGHDTGATSKTDGAANTRALIDSGIDHPAAKACTEYSADGHADYHLPASSELYQCWLNCPELFDKEPWYATSTQFSAYGSCVMDFSDGDQSNALKHYERRVRPVRRKFI
ncbi:DUF1566 domain-containing protein [Pseudomonas capsici]|uniref:DUF1566 domain-containing protein n=1 Tax=Pseudomonas capsici TaxID=2810614 RepID=UPI0021F0E3C6|nr:DUF1566 domain-containing protein [Pseudomonas capsici]MCV4343272.1 DUF1566 domain-containing protein [Pseudomonas capsici]